MQFAGGVKRIGHGRRLPGIGQVNKQITHCHYLYSVPHKISSLMRFQDLFIKEGIKRSLKSEKITSDPKG